MCNSFFPPVPPESPEIMGENIFSTQVSVLSMTLASVPESIGVAEPGVKGKVQLLFKQELPEFGG